jgi:AraC family transcriptional regulator, transcriptional activator of pobA
MQEQAKFSIPFYQEINDFLISINAGFRSPNPDFYCLKLDASSSFKNYMPPFRKGFYFIGLVTDAGQTKITYDAIDATNLNSFLVFQSPNLTYSFMRDNAAHGYLIYFKQELFTFLNHDLKMSLGCLIYCIPVFLD